MYQISFIWLKLFNSILTIPKLSWPSQNKLYCLILLRELSVCQQDNTLSINRDRLSRVCCMFHCMVSSGVPKSALIGFALILFTKRMFLCDGKKVVRSWILQINGRSSQLLPSEVLKTVQQTKSYLIDWTLLLILCQTLFFNGTV